MYFKKMEHIFQLLYFRYRITRFTCHYDFGITEKQLEAPSIQEVGAGREAKFLSKSLNIEFLD